MGTTEHEAAGGLTRRQFQARVGLGLVGAGVAGSGLAGMASALTGGGAPDSTVRGVTIGAQSYSFRDRSLDEAIAAMTTIGIGACELWSGHAEPDGRGQPRDRTPEQRKAAREAQQKWRETVGLDHFHRIRDQFAKAGIAINAYNFSFRMDHTDAEMARAFEMARALGAPLLTSSNGFDVLPRLVPLAEKEKFKVGVHNHSRLDPNEIVTLEQFEKAMAEYPALFVNLDIGHYTAADQDPVRFLEKHHARVVTLHIKDRKRNQGPNQPFGEGDTPIGPVLRLLRDKGWSIPANIEYEYGGQDTIAEVTKCLAYCRQALNG